MPNHVTLQDYNHLIAELGHRDTLRQMAAYGLSDRMRELVALLAEHGVIPRDTPVLKSSIIHGEV